MKYLLVLVFGLSFSFSVQALMADPRQMTNTGEFVPYSCEVWNDGCNDCEKTDSGYVCPPKNCATMRMGYCRKYEEVAQKRNEESPIPDNCTSWYDGCNTCGVANGRTTFCTERFCDQDQLEPAKCTAFADTNAIPPRPEPVVIPARPSSCQRWFDGCNTCMFHSTGSSSCTKMACQTYDEPRCLDTVKPAPQPIVPSEIPDNCTSWFDGCNTCGVANGRTTFCTEMACDPSAIEEPRCLRFNEDVLPVDDADNSVVSKIPELCRDWDYTAGKCLAYDDASPAEIGGMRPSDLPTKVVTVDEAPPVKAIEDLDVVRPGTPPEVLPIKENGELIEPKASFWGFIKYHLFSWMQ